MSVENSPHRGYVPLACWKIVIICAAPAYETRWSATVWLLIVNVAVFVAELAWYNFASFSIRIPLGDYFALSLEGLRHGFVWQLLTFQFMHGGVFHLLFNCWAIYVFGREVERSLGRTSFLILYLSSGVVGGLCQVLAGLLMGDAFSAPVVGASAGALGLIAAFALLYPEAPLMLLPFFITMRAKFLLLISALIAAVGIVFPGLSPGIAHAAHLGGLIAGFVFVRYAVHWHWPRLQRTRRPPMRRLVRVPPHQSARWEGEPPAAEDLPPEEFLSREVDPILDKISAHGIQSLTARERQVLEAARKKMAKR